MSKVLTEQALLVSNLNGNEWSNLKIAHTFYLILDELFFVGLKRIGKVNALQDWVT